MDIEETQNNQEQENRIPIWTRVILTLIATLGFSFIFFSYDEVNGGKIMSDINKVFEDKGIELCTYQDSFGNKYTMYAESHDTYTFRNSFFDYNEIDSYFFDNGLAKKLDEISLLSKERQYSSEYIQLLNFYKLSEKNEKELKSINKEIEKEIAYIQKCDFRIEKLKSEIENISKYPTPVQVDSMAHKFIASMNKAHLIEEKRKEAKRKEEAERQKEIKILEKLKCN